MYGLAATGKQVLMPLGSHHRYDLAYEEDGKLVKVQCKTGRLRKGALTFRPCSLGRGPARDYRGEVDFFGVVSHEREEIYLVPVADVPARLAHLRLTPAKNGQVSGVRLASDYLLMKGFPKLID